MKPLRFATLCSGVDAFGLGFERAGMECVYQCEQDKQCQSVLRRHWPNVPKGTDVYDEQAASDLIRLRPDVIAFGSPCTDLSVAGRRAGLAGRRSGVFYRCVELCFECDASWVVFENVGGLFSSHQGKDFATVLEAFTGTRYEVPREGWQSAGVAVSRLYSVAWRCLDPRGFSIPQRRNRVFLVASLGAGSGPWQVLSLADSLRRDTEARGQAGARLAAAITRGSASGRGVNPPGRRREDDVNLVPVAFGGNNTQGAIDVATACNAHGGTGRIDFESETFVVGPNDFVGSIAASGAGTARPRGMNDEQQFLIAQPTLTGSEAGETCDSRPCASTGMAVRRLLPIETERLMNFPDGHTAWGINERGERVELSDSARYRMCGNALIVGVAEWLGAGIVEAMSQ